MKQKRSHRRLRIIAAIWIVAIVVLTSNMHVYAVNSKVEFTIGDQTSIPLDDEKKKPTVAPPEIPVYGQEIHYEAVTRGNLPRTGLSQKIIFSLIGAVFLLLVAVGFLYLKKRKKMERIDYI